MSIETHRDIRTDLRSNLALYDSTAAELVANSEGEGATTPFVLVADSNRVSSSAPHRAESTCLLSADDLCNQTRRRRV